MNGPQTKRLVVPALAVAFIAGAGAGGVATLFLRRQPVPPPDDTRFLNFDSESTSLETLASGWSSFEHDPENDTFVWCASRQCTLAVWAHGQRDRVVRMRMWPFTYAGVHAQTVTLKVNDVVVATHALRSVETWDTGPLPSSAWKEGKNVLELKFGYAEAPAKRVGGSTDERTLSMALDWLEIISL